MSVFSFDVRAEELPQPQEITDEEIAGFLYRVSDETKEKVKTISGYPAKDIFIPVLFGATLEDIEDTWGHRRSGGRRHEGTDIIVSRGELVVTPTEAVVVKIGYDRRGGNFVLTANPGGEQFYYAHLEKVRENASVGDVLVPGDVIGYVGSTGNAQGPHLHLGIYYKGKAINPFPRITEELPLDRKLDFLANNVQKSNISHARVIEIVDAHTNLLDAEGPTDITVPYAIASLIEDKSIVSAIRYLSGPIEIGVQGEGVRLLQQFLIDTGDGPHARALARAGTTGYFGYATQNALAEYQRAVGISPARGYFGPLTRESVLARLSAERAGFSKSSVVADDEAASDGFEVIAVQADLEIGSKGREVGALQEFLIHVNTGLQARALKNAGATRYFGALTRNALAEYQKSSGISPARGYFGPLTRSHLKNLKEAE